MIEKFRRLLEVLPTGMNKVRFDNAAVNQALGTLYIEHWDGLVGYNYTGVTEIAEKDDKLVGTRHWAKGSYPVEEPVIRDWINRIYALYNEDFLYLEHKDEASN